MTGSQEVTSSSLVCSTRHQHSVDAFFIWLIISYLWLIISFWIFKEFW